MWGVTIGTTVLQTQLSQRLPTDFLDTIPGGVSFAYSIIPIIPTLSDEFQVQVRDAFAGSLVVLWEVMIGVAGMGLLGSLLMKGVPLHTHTDEKWGMEDGQCQGENIRPGVVNIELRNHSSD